MVTGQFSSVSFADEGEYICDLYVIEHSASVLLTVMLYVVGEFTTAKYYHVYIADTSAVGANMFLVDQ